MAHTNQKQCHKPTLICAWSIVLALAQESVEGRKHLGKISGDKMWAGEKNKKMGFGLCFFCFSRTSSLVVFRGNGKNEERNKEL